MTGDKPKIWEAHLGPHERAMAAHYAPREITATTPALLLVDLYNKAFGDRRAPIETSREQFPSSCGEVAWDAIAPIKRLLQATRNAGAPVAYSTGETRPEARVGTATRRTRRSDDDWSLAIKDDFAPQEGELVVYKNAPSAFFGTSLSTHLRTLGVDTVVLAGESTSGCVRATAVDAHSHGFGVVVAEEAVFDRSPLSHAVSLFDLHHKYATVMSVDEALSVLRGSAAT